MGAAGGVERFEDLHDLPVRLLQGPSVDSARLWSKTSSEAPEGPLVSDRHDRPTTPAEKGDQLSAERELTCPPTGILGCPRSVPLGYASGGCRGSSHPTRSISRPPRFGRTATGRWSADQGLIQYIGGRPPMATPPFCVSRQPWRCSPASTHQRLNWRTCEGIRPCEWFHR